ncbi:hypothetical protein GGI03_003842, partial [Coemansia sp. RSA 2337]
LSTLLPICGDLLLLTVVLLSCRLLLDIASRLASAALAASAMSVAPALLKQVMSATRSLSPKPRS